MSLLETAGAALAGGIGGGIVTLIGRELVQRYRSPELTLDWLNSQSNSPAIVSREINTEKTNIDNIPEIEKQIRTRDIHLSLKNTGRSPARECQIKADIYKEGHKVPISVRLGNRMKPPILYENPVESAHERTAPFQVNRNDKVIIDLLRLIYSKETINNRKKLKEVSMRTLSSFRPFKFDSGKKYTIHITATAANAEPAKFGLTLEWSGGSEEESIRKSITKTDPNTIHI